MDHSKLRTSAPYTPLLGKLSLLIAALVFVFVAGSMIFLVLFVRSDSQSADAPIAISAIGWLLAPTGHMIGLILGIFGVRQPNSKKLVSVLGIAANAILGGIGALLIVSLTTLAPALAKYFGK